MKLRLFFFAQIVYLNLWAGVVRLNVVERQDVENRREFGSAGAYERITAKALFTVDPTLAENLKVRDIALAPRNEFGLVEFSADVYVLKPADSAKGNGTVLYEVSNRGGRGSVGMFDAGAGPSNEFGDAFLLQQGYTLVWMGWQFDVPTRPGLLRLTTPSVKGVTGTVRSEFVPQTKVQSFSLADRNHIAYDVADPAEDKAQLTVRDKPDGPRRTIPRSAWSFSDSSHVQMDAGFVPGKLYDIVYTAKDPQLVGLSMAATRDLISFLKYGGNETSLLGDQTKHIKRAIGFGTSQSGRFLRTFLYQGFNGDEQGRKVFDGVWAHVGGGGRGSFNHRFAQASRDGHRMLNTLYPSDIFPFTEAEQTDPETGITDGLLSHIGKPELRPKIFYTNGSYEYWGRVASLIHTSIDGKKDVDPGADSRIYYLAGTQHGPGTFPPAKATVTQNTPNVNDYRFHMRALLVGLNDWVKEGKQPPASNFPRIDKDQLVAFGALQFPKIPGVKLPDSPLVTSRMNFGAEFASKGIVTVDPPEVGKPFPTLLPQVDRDGNETSGLRSPELQVPLGTYMGWNLRNPEIGAPTELYDMVGSWIPFAKTKAARQKAQDPRLSVDERYKSREDYMGKIRAAADDLVKKGYLLQTDIPRIVSKAEAQWNWIARIE